MIHNYKILFMRACPQNLNLVIIYVNFNYMLIALENQPLGRDPMRIGFL